MFIEIYTFKKSQIIFRNFQLLSVLLFYFQKVSNKNLILQNNIPITTTMCVQFGIKYLNVNEVKF